MDGLGSQCYQASLPPYLMASNKVSTPRITPVVSPVPPHCEQGRVGEVRGTGLPVHPGPGPRPARTPPGHTGRSQWPALMHMHMALAASRSS